MNKVLDVLLFFGEAAGIYAVCYFISLKISHYSKYRNEKKQYFILFLASIICLLFFITYGLLDNYFDIEIRMLTPLWFLLVPISTLLTILYFFAFVLKKND